MLLDDTHDMVGVRFINLKIIFINMDNFFVKFKRGKQNKLILKAILKAGSERKLETRLGIPHQTIHDYKDENCNLPLDRTKLILKYVNKTYASIKSDIEDLYPKNWGRVKGGKNSYLIKVKNGTFEANLSLLKLSSSRRMKTWHKFMKKNHLGEYHKIQYGRFKKIGGYKYKDNKGQFVRNKWEQKLSNLIVSKNLDYEYEPLILIDKKAYFPDFKIKNILIEATMWKGYLKVDRLKTKIKNYRKDGFVPLIVVPKEYKKFYISLGKSVIDFNEFNLFLNSIVQKCL